MAYVKRANTENTFIKENMEKEKFMSKLENFLQETIGDTWEILNTDITDDSIYIKGITVWNLKDSNDEEEMVHGI